MTRISLVYPHTIRTNGEGRIYSVTHPVLGSTSIRGPHPIQEDFDSNVNLNFVDNRRDLREMHAQASEEEFNEAMYFRVGGPPVDPDYVTRVLSGEQIKSFRSLLKIPFPSQEYVLQGTPGTHSQKAFTNDLYGAGHYTNPREMLWYLFACYNARKGGMVSDYTILGDGLLEVSMNQNYTLAASDTYGRAGTAMTHSSVNPHMTVKFPGQRATEYAFGQFEELSGGALQVLSISGWNGDVRVKEYRSTAEDFSLMAFRGAAAIASVDPLIPP